jgi:hypothetical protein
MAEKTKAQESEAVAAARAEVVSVTRELGKLQRRLVTQAQALRQAASAGEAIGIMDGKPWTVEQWLADYLEAHAGDDFAESLGPAVEGFQRLARMDYTEEARKDLADWQADAAKHAAKV